MPSLMPSSEASDTISNAAESSPVTPPPPKYNLWFLADPHFGHANIIHHCKRPFSTVEEMDKTILDNVNAVVKPGDQLCILGDFCGQRRQQKIIRSYLDQIKLNPQQILFILGNHDNEKETRKVFPRVHALETIRYGEQRIVLCHYAMRVWNGSHHGVWHLYGHSHGTLQELPNSKSFDVGVDSWQFKPVSFEQVAAKMATKTFVPVDHHGICKLTSAAEV